MWLYAGDAVSVNDWYGTYVTANDEWTQLIGEKLTSAQLETEYTFGLHKSDFHESPEPTALLLFCTSLNGLAGFRTKFKT